MKIDDLLEEDISGDLRELEKLEEAYDDLALLGEAFESGNFGVLIGKRGKLNYNDILQIKRKIQLILKSNVVLRGSQLQHRGGDVKLNLLGQSIAHGFEFVALSALTAVFAGGVVAGAATANPFLAGGSGAGATLTAAGVQSQYEYLKSLGAASKLLNIMDSFEDLNPKKRIQPSAWRRFMNLLKGKSQEQIHQDVEKKIKQIGMKNRKKFEKALGKIPKTIEYEDHGRIYELPIERLFD